MLDVNEGLEQLQSLLASMAHTDAGALDQETADTETTWTKVPEPKPTEASTPHPAPSRVEVADD